MSKKESLRVVIIGSGVAGLACAMTLQRAGIKCIVIEKESRVGGRVRTERSEEGFLFDRGFQVLLDAYPELPSFLDVKKLELKKFGSGALIHSSEHDRLLANPLRHPQYAMTSLFTDIADQNDKLRLVPLLARAAKASKFKSLKGETTIRFLEKQGFSERFISDFWRPFLTGVYLDPTLSLDAHYFLFLLRAFSFGSATLPKKGMAEIPKQMADSLAPDSILVSTPVSEIHRDHVKLADGRTFKGVVVKAFRGTPSNEDRSVSTYYFTAPEKPDWGKWLVLIPSRAGYKLNSLSLLSEVSEAYAPPGKVLISASVVGHAQEVPADVIGEEILKICRKPLTLRHLRTDTIHHALPVLGPIGKEFSYEDGIYECGDHLSAPSLNGALRSGRLTAEAIIGWQN